MCLVPQTALKETFYIRVSSIPVSFSHATVRDLFSRFGHIAHTEFHYDHCYVGYVEIVDAIRALDLGRYIGGKKFKTSLVAKHFNVSYDL